MPQPRTRDDGKVFHYDVGIPMTALDAFRGVADGWVFSLRQCGYKSCNQSCRCWERQVNLAICLKTLLVLLDSMSEAESTTCMNGCVVWSEVRLHV